MRWWLGMAYVIVVMSLYRGRCDRIHKYVESYNDRMLTNFSRSLQKHKQTVSGGKSEYLHNPHKYITNRINQQIFILCVDNFLFRVL